MQTQSNVKSCVEKWKIYSDWRKISSNQLFSTFFSKTVTFTKFCPKCVRVKIRNFHTVQYSILQQDLLKCINRFHWFFSKMPCVFWRNISTIEFFTGFTKKLSSKKKRTIASISTRRLISRNFGTFWRKILPGQDTTVLVNNVGTLPPLQKLFVKSIHSITL